MFAILISEDNLKKILESDSVPHENRTALEYFLRHREDWYIITGYVTRFGSFESYAILPGYVFRPTFDYDPEKIKTEWNQIVRKESP